MPFSAPSADLLAPKGILRWPHRFRITYEDRAEDPLEGREMLFDDEAGTRAGTGDDIDNPVVREQRREMSMGRRVATV